MPGSIASALVVAGLLLAAPAPGTAQAAASAAPPASLHTQTMVYELYAGGINAVHAKLDVAYEAGDRYRLELEAETKGFLGKLVPWNGVFATKGWRLKDGSDTPEIHWSEAVWKGDKDVTEYHYDKDGSFKKLTIIEAGKDESPEGLADELVQGTTDSLTATLQAMKAYAEKGSCEGSSEVFDGKRRFKLVFRQVAEDQLSPTEYNVYSGPAARCEVEVMPVSGEWHKKPRGWASIQEQGRQKGSLPTFWVARIDEQGPAVPVKLRVKTDYGTLFMHLVHYKNGVKEIKAAQDG